MISGLVVALAELLLLLATAASTTAPQTTTQPAAATILKTTSPPPPTNKESPQIIIPPPTPNPQIDPSLSTPTKESYHHNETRHHEIIIGQASATNHSDPLVKQDEDSTRASLLLQNKNKNENNNNNLKHSQQQPQQPIYTNQFVIEVEGGEEEARKLAKKHGFVYLNHILGNFYHLEHKRLSKRSLSANLDGAELDISIQDEPQVLRLKRQVLKRRVKRDFLDLPLEQPQQQPYQRQQTAFGRSQQPSGIFRSANQPARPIQMVRPNGGGQQLQQQQQATGATGRLAHHQYTRPANQPPNYTPPPRAQAAAPKLLKFPPNNQMDGAQMLVADSSSSPGEMLEAAASASAANLFFQQQLNANNSNNNINRRPPNPMVNVTAGSQIPPASTANQTFQRPFNDPSWPLMWYLDGGAKNGFDLNVMAAWKMGFTGKGIVITILDDGLEKDHPDLQANYDPLASFDINGDDADPMPRYDANDSNRHGTRCAGEVAAVPDNNICSIGIAYNSKVGGVRMLDGDVTDAVEARSLGLNNQHIHIYSASWGPDDNGKTVDGPGELATRAFMEGVTNGRQGLGSIFVFASGNGGREHDNCNCDGYTNSIWTLSISSATENGYVPWYIEACSSTLATTYSSGSYEERQIATTDLHHTCTSSHTGTSASAPLAAGICALVLESNPKLTWRDMQHIVVKTAKPANLIAKDWRTNAMGRNVSHAFGYGLMDAAAMIIMAKKWTTVPKQYTCEVRSPQMELLIRPKGYVELKLRAECANVRFLEHVQSKVTLTAARRGDLHIYLISPHGTRSTLLAQRPNDLAEQGFRNWPFMTVHSWGESPNGNWTLEVHNDGKPLNKAFLKEMTLILYGTYEDPNRHLVDGTIMAPLTSRHSPPPHHTSQANLQNPAPNQQAPAGVGSQRPQSPPGPSFVELTHPSAGQTSGTNTNKPEPTWTFSVPPPAITSPAPASSTPFATNQHPASKQMTTPPPPPPPPTTQTSYLTSFKTIVSSSVTTSTSSSTGSSSPSKPTSFTTTTTTTTTTSSPPTKADFDIVSAPIETKPGSKIELQDGSLPMKPAVGGDTSQPTALPGELPLPPAPDIDQNQLDLKLSKDYRSSGDHYAASGERLIELASSANGKSSAQTPGEASSALHSVACSWLLLGSMIFLSFRPLLERSIERVNLVRIQTTQLID